MASSNRIDRRSASALTRGQADRAVSFARRQIGDRYQWGGNGPDAWDCSGLTSAALRAAGVNIPRTSSQQYAASRHVPRSQTRAGDLVFYDYGAGNVTHVAIATGPSRMVEASRPGTPVKETPIRSDALVGVGRFGR